MQVGKNFDKFSSSFDSDIFKFNALVFVYMLFISYVIG